MNGGMYTKTFEVIRKEAIINSTTFTCCAFDSFSHENFAASGKDSLVHIWSSKKLHHSATSRNKEHLKDDISSERHIERSHSKACEVVTLDTRGQSVLSLAFSPISPLLLIGLENGCMVFYDTHRDQVSSGNSAHRGSIISISFDPKQPRFCTGANDGTAKLWSIESKTVIHTMRGHTGSVVHTAFSPDGGWVFTVDSVGVLRIWESDKGCLISSLIPSKATNFADHAIISANLTTHPTDLIVGLALHWKRSTTIPETPCSDFIQLIIWDLDTMACVTTKSITNQGRSELPNGLHLNSYENLPFLRLIIQFDTSGDFICFFTAFIDQGSSLHYWQWKNDIAAQDSELHFNGDSNLLHQNHLSSKLAKVASSHDLKSVSHLENLSSLTSSNDLSAIILQFRINNHPQHSLLTEEYPGDKTQCVMMYLTIPDQPENATLSYVAMNVPSDIWCEKIPSSYFLDHSKELNEDSDDDFLSRTMIETSDATESPLGLDIERFLPKAKLSNLEESPDMIRLHETIRSNVEKDHNNILTILCLRQTTMSRISKQLQTTNFSTTIDTLIQIEDLQIIHDFLEGLEINKNSLLEELLSQNLSSDNVKKFCTVIKRLLLSRQETHVLIANSFYMTLLRKLGPLSNDNSVVGGLRQNEYALEIAMDKHHRLDKMLSSTLQQSMKLTKK